MGFGSYDESEQTDTSVDTDEDGAVDVHENDHDGEVSLDTGEMSTADLLDKIHKSDAENED